MMQTKTITISTDNIAKTILYTIAAVIAIPLIYMVLFHGWVYYILYEWGEPVFKSSMYIDSSGNMIEPYTQNLAGIRVLNIFTWLVILFSISLLSLDGNSLYREWEIKIPVLFNFSNDKDEIIELYKEAASYAAEGKQHLADEVYDLINKMENK